VDANRARSSQLEDRLSAIDERIERLAATAVPPAATVDAPEIATPVTPPEPAWRRAEIELLLRVAQRQASLAGDAEAAATALAEADRVIEALDDPELAPVRRQIADDLLALRSVAQPDLDGIAFRLGSLQARVANLPVREGAARGEAPTAAPAEPDDGGLDRLERKSREFLSGLVRVRDSAVADRVFHTPAEIWFLRRNLELELQATRVAILTENPGAYRDSLAKAQRWAEAYFEPGDPGVQAFVSALGELSEQAVDVEIPDVSGSLRTYLETAAVE
jgi:uroporphyrin-3 C-methyltransferase